MFSGLDIFHSLKILCFYLHIIQNVHTNVTFPGYFFLENLGPGIRFLEIFLPHIKRKRSLLKLFP